MHVGDGWLVSSSPYRARTNGLCRGAFLVACAKRRVSQAEEASPAESEPCSAQLRPYVRMYFQCSALSSAYLASTFTDVEALLCASPRSVFQQPWLEKLDLQHHVFVGWLLRATREDSVTMLTASRGLGTP